MSLPPPVTIFLFYYYVYKPHKQTGVLINATTEHGNISVVVRTLWEEHAMGGAGYSHSLVFRSQWILLRYDIL
jgi:hypothetical protein